MTTYQAVLYAIVHGFTQFFPVGEEAHRTLAGYFLGWPKPEGVLLGGLTFGSFLALFSYFRHDWASIISSFLQVILFRKRPMTLDERMPLFLALVSLFPLIVWYNFHEAIADFFTDPFWVAVSLLAFSFVLWFADSFSRKKKGMFDWNWVDCLFIGLGECLFLIPGCGGMFGSFSMALFRNYDREASAKFAFYNLMPLLGVISYFGLRDLNFHIAAPMPGISWFTFGIAVIVSFCASLLAIGGFVRHVQKRGLNQYVFYRLMIGTAATVAIWLHGRHVAGLN